MDPDHEAHDDPSVTVKKKTLRIAMAEDVDDPGRLLDLEQLESLEHGPLHEGRPMGDDDDELNRVIEGEGMDEEEEKDNDYESAEEELAADYDAELYFDNGADDDRDDHDGGEDHDGDMA